MRNIIDRLMSLVSSYYYEDVKPHPGKVHVGWYPNEETKRNLLRYMIKNGIPRTSDPAGWHVTVLQHGNAMKPTEYPSRMEFDPPMRTPRELMRVTPLVLHGVAKHGSPFGVILPRSFDKIKTVGDKMHRRFNLSPQDYLYHLTLGKVRPDSSSNRVKTVGDYYKLPHIDFPLEFDHQEIRT